MNEKFEKWNKLKQKINFGNKQKFYVKQREIWSVRMGQNIGFEEDGKGDDFERPVLVLKKIGIVYLCLSMTRKGRNNDFYFSINNIKDSYVILSQPKLFDLKRFHYKIGVVSMDKFNEIQKKLKTLWF
ncbi:type II toxin-antitoxin system PemK/MazF family toxin [Candidatus Gracilibacteria bacterium]|nr:type II toxin-antitoxin system PemK/MazF family toxin [Candidatus Gracilibacteria bacterium]